jgi:hypothetical protein
LLVMLFGIWTLPGPHQHWLMGHLKAMWPAALANANQDAPSATP